MARERLHAREGALGDDAQLEAVPPVSREPLEHLVQHGLDLARVHVVVGLAVDEQHSLARERPRQLILHAGERLALEALDATNEDPPDEPVGSKHLAELPPPRAMEHLIGGAGVTKAREDPRRRHALRHLSGDP
ncbi:MAG: hypothetical protein E6G47_05980 [Actinobacteria bacterium]|nr:MAG: hypothetical protein E6G47_05980 [Actinomycetota bacterium]